MFWSRISLNIISSCKVWIALYSISIGRIDLIRIPVEPDCDAGAWMGPNGEALQAQRTDNNWLVQVPVPGYTVISWQPQETQPETITPFTCEQNGITTPYYAIAWNESGQLTKLYDLEHKRNVLPAGARGNLLQVHEDKPLRFDAWDIDIFYKQKVREVDDLLSVEIVEMGALRAVVRFAWRYLDSCIKQDMIVYADDRRIDFVTEADWHEQQQLLKVAFPVDIRSTESTYDIQFGNVRRPTHWNTSRSFRNGSGAEKPCGTVLVMPFPRRRQENVGLSQRIQLERVKCARAITQA